MNKYFISGKLTHKASDHNTKRCEIEKSRLCNAAVLSVKKSILTASQIVSE